MAKLVVSLENVYGRASLGVVYMAHWTLPGLTP
jgi:hypothetical protein